MTRHFENDLPDLISKLEKELQTAFEEYQKGTFIKHG